MANETFPTPLILLQVATRGKSQRFESRGPRISNKKDQNWGKLVLWAIVLGITTSIIFRTFYLTAFSFIFIFIGTLPVCYFFRKKQTQASDLTPSSFLEKIIPWAGCGALAGSLYGSIAYLLPSLMHLQKNEERATYLDFTIFGFVGLAGVLIFIFFRLIFRKISDEFLYKHFWKVAIAIVILGLIRA